MGNSNDFAKVSGFFDWQAFTKDKDIRFLGKKPWLNYETKEPCGTDVNAVITRDDTRYNLKEGEVVSNLYRTFSIKVRKNVSEINVPRDAKITLVNPAVTIYGRYTNQLSIKCDDVLISDDNKKEGG